MTDNFITTIGGVLYGGTENLRRLPRNADELATEMQRLRDLRDDLRNRAENQARHNRAVVISTLLWGWMTRVKTLGSDADEFKRCFDDSGSSRLATRYSLANNVVDLLQKVAKLIDQGNELSDRGQLVQPQHPNSVQLVPSEITSTTTLVGAEETLQQIKDYIMDDSVGTIGVWGMGGVGKTTLLKVINNEFLTEEACRAKFDVAIWVSVSREAKDIPTIQKTIASRLRISLSDDMMHNDTLFVELRKKRFLLLLDDVWESLDLLDVGIPLPKQTENRSKILFTTRSEEVCGEMDVDEIVRVVPLDAERSWELFCSKFGRKSLRGPDDPNIQPLAKQVVAKCGGLPISLITVGRAMAKAKTIDDWREAIIKLDHRPAELSQGMEKQVLRSLRFSFDQLRSKTLQDCLLYLALFPEDWYILADDVIDHWICEGFLDSDVYDEPDIEDTRRRARNLITELQNACLLEAYDDGMYDGELLREPCVRLHDTIRDMALWIAGYEYVVLAGYNCIVSQVPKTEIWQKATKISLIGNEQIKEWPSCSWNPYCPNLTALLLGGSVLVRNISRNQALLTCTSMPALKVLDLSNAGLTELPIRITSLTSLHFLSLKGNKLTSLPVELGNLVNLRKLILKNNRNLQSIPREALIRLSSLQVLDMTYCAREFLQLSELDELNNLKSLCEMNLSCDVCSWELLRVIAESPFLCRCIRELIVRDDPSPPPMGDVISQQIHMLSERIKRLDLCGDRDKPVKGELMLHADQLQHLHVLCISCFTDANISIVTAESSPLFPRLTYLGIDSCGCNDLKWISGLPCLQVLRVENCGELTEILPDESCSDNWGPVLFPKLELITLFHLPQLRSISMDTLLFPSLEVLSVRKCPQLRRLPFRHVCNLAEIIGSKEWWDGLEWNNNNNNSDHDLIRERFGSKFSR